MSEQPRHRPAPFPADEEARIEELRSLGILDTAREERFDRLAAMAADVFDVPVVLVSLVDRDRQWFKAVRGIDVRQTPRHLAFAAHTILQRDLLVVPDTLRDDRFADHPLARATTPVRFYAGAVLRGPRGHPVGSLCLMDRQPRELGQQLQNRLLRLARVVEVELHRRRQMEALRQRIERTAYYDELTGLPNRRLCRERLEQAIRVARRTNRRVALIRLDLDRFGALNNALGYEAGDRVLKQAARRLVRVEEDATVARWQDDEFAIVDLNTEPSADPSLVVSRVLAAMEQPFSWEGQSFRLSVSVGASVFPDDAGDAGALVDRASSALKAARRQQGSSYRFHTRGLDAEMVQRFALEGQLRQALAEDALRLLYQPKISLEDGQVCGAEALVRWQHPQMGEISPAIFIPVAEHTGLIDTIGRWVAKQACQQIEQWRHDGLGEIPVAVNVSAHELHRSDFVERRRQILTETDVDPQLLSIEITESSLIEDMDHAIEAMRQLSELGVTFSIDDFGTGYSSLAYLKQLPLQAVKIDRSFVRDATHENQDAAIVEAAVALARALGLRVVAEGVETSEQLELLRKLGCHEAQGFLFGRPCSAEDLAEFVRTTRARGAG